ncbi:sporulation membrane protein YtaF [Virgibacillus halophilus]|uniref:Sporulation membrane protein YtaF n=1 Tax=Tigheibacillus halophilus TaxID=361280 RepID=A0ABU5C3J3_9BACI|nr:sporulation membrane protein YtaF [Virgibacillus halophilus]
MLYYTGLIFLVIAVSIDGFGVGVTYGMRTIRVPFAGLLIIMCCSGFVVLVSMTIGDRLSNIISPDMTKILGGSILICLGLFSLVNVIRSYLSRQQTNIETKSKSGLTGVKKVLATPDQADLDHSGIISSGEALLLGTALSMDAFGAGIGAAIVGYSPVVTPALIACMSGIFLFSGIKLGTLLAQNKKMQHMSFIPPILLISLGIFNLF